MKHTLQGDRLICETLFEVRGGLVEAYNAALEQAVGKRSQQQSFRIDKRGESRELEEELGPNYLQAGAANRFAIIVSPEQRDATLLHEEFSYDEFVLDHVYEHFASTIAVCTRVDALYGELDDGLQLIADLGDLLRIRKVRLALRTPSGFIRRAGEVQALTARLEQSPWLLIEGEAAVPKRLLTLIRQVGDVRNYPISEIEGTFEVQSFSTRLFDGAFVFRELGLSGGTAGMRRPDARRKRGQGRRLRRARTTLVYNDASLERPEEGPGMEVVPLSDVQRLVEFLVDHDLARFSQKRVETCLGRIEDLTLAARGDPVGELDPAARSRCLERARGELPEAWQELHGLLRRLAGGHRFDQIVGGLRPSTQAMLLEPEALDAQILRVVGALLTKLWAHDYEAMLRHNRRDLERAYAAMEPEALRRYVGARVRVADQLVARARAEGAGWPSSR